MRLDRLVALGLVCFGMLLLHRVPAIIGGGGAASSTVAFGFILLASYLFAAELARLRTPKITGYILFGIALGPAFGGLLTREVAEELRLVDDLALTFIALAAGAELRLAMLRTRLRGIVLTVAAQLVTVLCGVAGALYMIRSALPFTRGLGSNAALALSVLAAALSLARSPSSCIAIISETKARGPFTETVLGVTVAADVLAILVFAAALAVAEVVLAPGRSLNVVFLGGIGGELAVSIAIGVLLGRGIGLYLHRVRSELTLFLLALAFMVTKLSAAMALLLDAKLGVRFHLEPMLICLAAGFVVQNRTPHGEAFVKVLDRASLPIFVLFFTLSGASLEVETLRTTWYWALVLVALRGGFLALGSLLGGWLARDPSAQRQRSALAYLTQAGVSLGLVKLLAERVPEQSALGALLTAGIILNQVLGPIALKLALSGSGETREARLAARP